MAVWRPILAKVTTLQEIQSGACTLDDIFKLNALLDAQAAAEEEAYKG